MSPATPRQTPDPSAAQKALPTHPADWLSAAADGDADALDRACRAFRDDDARAQADWNTYHLIGDVMRSSDLATAPARDAAFLAAFRERLAAEPVVVAPPVRPVAAARSARWRVPAAAVAGAAGVAVVAGVLVMSRGGAGDGPGVPMAATAIEAPATTVVRDGVIRDARLEEFMRVHQGAAGAMSMGPQGVRQVDLVVTPVPQR